LLNKGFHATIAAETDCGAVGDMQKTRVFIASSSESLKLEILEIEAFFLRLNNCYIDKGLYFNPVLSSAPGGVDALTREQNIQRTLEESSVAFFLIDAGGNPRRSTPPHSAEGGKADFDSDIREAYKSARDSYHKTGRPKIAIYAKQNPGFRDDDYTASVIASEMLEAENEEPVIVGLSNTQFRIPNAEFYTNTYKHIDTLKLGILMQIKQLNLPGVDIRLSEGNAWQGNDELLALDNVESVAGFENLQNLKLRRSELETRFYSVRARYIENPDDEAIYEEFFEVSKQRSNAMQELRDIESQLYTMIEGMYEHTAQGRLSKRQAEGYRLIERGLLNEARDVLDFYAIVSESRHREEMADRLAEEAQVNANELMQLKDVNAALLDWEGVDECYREAVRLEEKYNLYRKATGDYVEFLFRQHRHNEAIELGEKLRRHYLSPDSGASEEDKAFLYNALGIAYDESKRMDKSEEMLKAALAIRTARTEGDPDIISKGVATVHNNLGNVYFAQNRFDDAIEAHTQALEIRKKLFERNPEAFGEYLACSCINLGEVYNNKRKYDESVELLLYARDIVKVLPVCVDVPKDELLSCCYSELGVAYSGLEQYEDAEEQFDAALVIQLEQADGNPGVFEPRVAESYFSFAIMYFEAKRYPEAEEKFNAAAQLYRRLAGRTPEAFEPELAECFSSMGELFIEMKRLDDASDALSNAIRLYDKYREANPFFVEKALEAQRLLDSLNASQLLPDIGSFQFTPGEKEVAMLLTEGLSQREISRKLNIPIADVSQRVNAIREKVSGVGSPDPLIDRIVVDYKLSKRETDMLVCLRDGASTEKIAADLFITEDTVRSHVYRLLKKLDIENRQAVPAWLEAYN